MVSASNTFLYFQRGTPATDEYQQALRDYSPGSPIGTGMSFGWTAGKLFERAAATISEPPSSQAILAGLWSIHGDTLGGITAPLTFIKNAPAPQRMCWFHLTVQNKDWVSPDGFAQHCK